MIIVSPMYRIQEMKLCGLASIFLVICSNNSNLEYDSLASHGSIS